MCVPQDSLDELQMDDFWKEVENIARSGGGAGRGEGAREGEVQEEEQQKTPEGTWVDLEDLREKKRGLVRSSVSRSWEMHFCGVFV